MTTLNPTTHIEAVPGEPLRRILAVTRLHFVNKFQLVFMPLMILGAILLLNLAIWWIIVGATTGASNKLKAEHGFSYSGSVAFIFIYCLVIAVQAINRTFPFSLGYGVTRRDFYLGSVLAFAILSIGFSVVLTVMSIIEKATNGWGVGGHMFAPNYIGDTTWGSRFVLYLLTFLFFMFVGSAVATVYVRWKSTGIIVFFGVVAVILLAAIAIITLGHHWTGVWNWVGDAGSVGLALWSLVLTAIAGVAGFFILQRATPKN